MAINIFNPFDDYRKRLEEAKKKLRTYAGKVESSLESIPEPVKTVLPGLRVAENLFDIPEHVKKIPEYREELGKGTLSFIEAGGRSLPFYQNVEKFVAEKGLEARKKSPFVKDFRQNLVKMGFQPMVQPGEPEEPSEFQKAAAMTGAITSNVAQFWLTGKISQGLLQRVAPQFFKVKGAADITSKLGKFAPFAQMIDPKTGKVITGVNKWLQGAVQWGLFTAPKLEGTREEKIQKLAGAMTTGAFFGVAGYTIPDPVKRYLADIVAPYLITRYVENDPDKAVDDATWYALAGIPFLAMSGVKPVKGKPPQPAGYLGAGEPPPAGAPPAGIVPVAPAEPSTMLAQPEAGGKYNIVESEQAKKYRTRHKYTEVVEVDAQKLLEAIETRGEPLAWSERRLEQALERPETDAHPLVVVNSKGMPDVTDGGHRIAAAAERGQTIEIAVHKSDVGAVQKYARIAEEPSTMLAQPPSVKGGGDLAEEMKKLTDLHYKAEEQEGIGAFDETVDQQADIVADIASKKGWELDYNESFQTYELELSNKDIPIKEAQRKVVDMLNRLGMKVQENKDGTLRLIHETSRKNAESILKEGMSEEQGDLFFSPQEGALNDVGQYGDTRLHIDVDPRSLIIRPEGELRIEDFGKTKPVEIIGEKAKPKLTVAKLEKEQKISRLTKLTTEATTPTSYAKRIRAVSNQIDASTSTRDLKTVRQFAVKELAKMTGESEDVLKTFPKGTPWAERRLMLIEMAKADPMNEEPIEALEELLDKLDPLVNKGRTTKAMVHVSEILNLPKSGKFFIPYGKYSTRGTTNREWVQENIPLLYMGNKRGMMGYILDALGVEQRDLGSILAEDVRHLGKFNKVIDLFGGSGLLSNLSKKFFPSAEITYNEYDKDVLKALDIARKNPKEIQKFVSQVGRYLADNPGADWLAHFKRVYKEDENFRVTARFIEAVGGRTGEITPGKMRGLLRAIPNFAKVFKGVNMTNEDAIKVINRQIKNPDKNTLLWIDPPYIWSTGYKVGTEFERTEGFVQLLDKLQKLNKKGVKFVFFNNDPEIQVEKAGSEAVNLTNIMGKINELSKQKGIYILRDVNPIGAATRREIMITNLPYGKEINRFLNIRTVQSTIKKLKDDPAAAPREMLRLYRDLAGTSRYVPEKQKITDAQVKTIRELRARLRIKNRTLLPILDQLLGDVSFAKMTKEDGVKMIEWLQPKNWEVIEHEVEKTRDLQEKERLQLAIGDRAVPESDLEEEFGVIASMNKTIGEIENLARLIENTPRPAAPKPSTKNFIREVMGGLLGRYIPEESATKLLHIKHTWHTPFRSIITISTNHQNRMKKGLKNIFKELSEEQRKYVVYKQAGAEKDYKGKLGKLEKKQADEVADYIQEIAKVNIDIVNNLRAAKDQPPLKPRKPYIPYVINEDIAMAIDKDARTKFWKQRLKTPKDFAAGLFTHDPERIIDIWAESSGSWMKKNLYGAMLMDRFEDIYKVSDAASAYAREIVELDIYNMLPQSQKMLHSVGNAINKKIGSIYPRRIPVDEELAKSILNTSFGKELADQIKNGYLEVPRVQVPNISFAFHKVYYPMKLAWNFSFALLNRTQPVAGLPFVGAEAATRARVRTWLSFFPWAKARKTRDMYIRILEESGYEFGRMIAGEEIPRSKEYNKLLRKEIKGMTIGQWVDRSINFLADSTELANRLENMYQAGYFLTKMEKKTGVKLSREDKLKIAARFSAYINFLGGKGYAPIAQRNPIGRLLYIFQQYPLNQIDVYGEMLKISLKDKGAAQFWRMMGREGVTSDEAEEFYNELPNKSKANIFLVALAIAIPIATLYALARNWNIAERGMPQFPRVQSGGLINAIMAYSENPNVENKEKLKAAVENYFSISSYNKLKDALDSYKYGVLTSRASGRPIFTDKSLETSVLLLIFGRSSLEEYEKAYPQWLAKHIGGQKGPGRVAELEKESAKGIRESTDNAVEFIKGMQDNTDQASRLAFIRKMQEEGKLDERTTDKIKTYYTEKALGITSLERRIKNLNDREQAKFLWQELKDAGNADVRLKLLELYKKQGIITDNVIEEFKKLAEEGGLESGMFENIFR